VPVKVLAARLRSERGFTLVELLVAMVAGIVVLMAGLTILDVTMDQTTRSFSMVDATNGRRSRRSRTSFTQRASPRTRRRSRPGAPGATSSS